MAYQNNYNGNGNGNYSSQRGGYNGSEYNQNRYNNQNGGYRNQGQQPVNQGKPKYIPPHASFEIKGIICNSRNGGLFSTTSSGKTVYFSLLVGLKKPNGQVDQNGRPMYDEEKTFYRIMASNGLTERLTTEVTVPYTTLTVVGRIVTSRKQDGTSDFMFFANDFKIDKVPQSKGVRANNGGYNRNNYQRATGYAQNQNGNQRPARQENQVAQSQQQTPSYSYEQRPQNGLPPAEPQYNEEEFVPENEIPF